MFWLVNRRLPHIGLLCDPPHKWFVYLFFHFRFFFFNYIGILLSIHFVTVGILSSNPPCYSWNTVEHPPWYNWTIIESSTSLQLEYYWATYVITLDYYQVIHLVIVGILSRIHLITGGLLSSHPPRYSWNAIDQSTLLQLEYYRVSASLQLEYY